MVGLFATLKVDLFALTLIAMTHSRFRFEGVFQGFASGKKSPFKYLLVQTREGEDVHIKLKKALRMMLFRYLVPGDWIQVVGRQEWDRDRDEMAFKADEVVRIPVPSNSKKLEVCEPETHSSAPASPSAKAPKGKSPKILICQKSSCRKRGSAEVGAMVERSLSELGLADQVSVKYTGCMDRCKAGPNIVFTPSKAKYSRVKPDRVPTLVRQHCVR